MAKMFDNGQWQCGACGFNNRATNEVCGGNGPMGCKAPREDALPAMSNGYGAVPTKKGGAARASQPYVPAGPRGATNVAVAGGWICECGFKNNAKNEVCGGSGPMGCKLPKPGLEAMSPYVQPYVGAFEYHAPVASGGGGEWVCACGFKNKAQNEQCGGTGPMGCKSPRPQAVQAMRTPRGAAGAVGGGRALYQPGRVAYQPAAPVRSQVQVRIPMQAMQAAPAAPTSDWVCSSCGFKNKANNMQCGGTGPLGCKAPYAAPASARASRGVHAVHAVPMPPHDPRAVARAFSAPPATKRRVDDADKWVCTACGFKNRPQNTVCGGEKGTLGCKAPREDSMGEDALETIQQAEEEKWACPECGFTNKPTNEVCGGKGPLGCKAPKPGVEEAAEDIAEDGVEEAVEEAVDDSL